MSIVMPRAHMWDAAFDYVRLTYKEGELADETYALYRKLAVAIVASPNGESVEPRPFGAMGYRGENYGLVQIGRSPQGALIQASQWAAQALREINPPYDGVPRADVQVTVWHEGDIGEAVGAYAAQSAIEAKGLGASGWTVRHINGYGSGDTAYLGSRASELFVRIYDKGRESGDEDTYKDAIRYEVEFKNKAAAQVWAGSHRSAPDRHACATMVSSVLRRRGVSLALPEHLPGAGYVSRQNAASSTERRLAWLATQVRGTVDKLIADGVSSDHVRQLLGLA